MTDELASRDAMAQAELVRKREVSPLELVNAAIERIEKLNPQLNAVITRLYDNARKLAQGPLPAGPFRGVPLLLKDLNCASAGDPLCNGMRLLRDLGSLAPHDSHLAAKFKSAGFIILGKTNTPELGLNVTTEPQAFGPTRNPWDLDRSTGGSSGGSAAAVASRMVPIAHASDGGGSIRIPASECGIVGLKPSRGRVSLGPDVGDSWHGFGVHGVVTRSVRDMASALDAISGNEPGDPYSSPPQRRPFIEEVGANPGKLRIGFMRRTPSGAAPLHPDCLAAVEDAARLLQSAGHVVEESHPAALDEPKVNSHFGHIVSSHTLLTLRQIGRLIGRDVTREDVELWTWTSAERGAKLSAADYLASVGWLQVWARRVASWWAGGFDLLLTPTIAEPPPPLGALVMTASNPADAIKRIVQLMQFTPAYNITGQPAASLPLYWNSAGLPVGTQIVAAFGCEDLLLQVAAQLEQARSWKDRRAPVCA
jgi:amidase